MAKLLFEWDYSSYPGAQRYPNLFKPIQIGNLMIPNRIKYAATEDNFNDHDGFVTDADVAYMRAGPKGSWAVCASCRGCTWTRPARARAMWARPRAWDDKYIPGSSGLAEAIHSQTGRGRLPVDGLRPGGRRGSGKRAWSVHRPPAAPGLQTHVRDDQCRGQGNDPAARRCGQAGCGGRI